MNEEDILKVHTKEHYDKVMALQHMPEGENTKRFTPDNYECKDTPESVLLSAGGAITGLRYILGNTSNSNSAFC